MGVLFLGAWVYLVADTLLGVSWLSDIWDRHPQGYVGDPIPLTVEIPHLVGCRFSQSTLPELQGLVYDVTYVYHPTAEEGRILSQTPAGGVSRKVTARDACVVSLVVSMGREQASVPRLSGMDPREAEGVLRRLGLTARRVYLPVEGKGGVLMSRPASGCLLDRGDTVTLVLGRTSPRVASPCPDLTGLSAEQAEAVLRDAGLTLGEIKTLPTLDPFRIREGEDVVLAQSHAAGSYLPYGHAVSITLRTAEY